MDGGDRKDFVQCYRIGILHRSGVVLSQTSVLHEQWGWDSLPQGVFVTASPLRTL